jgi:hypothetical protein
MTVRARVNPAEDVIRGAMPTAPQLRRMIRQIVRELLTSADVIERLRERARERETGAPLRLETGAHFLAMGPEYRMGALGYHFGAYGGYGEPRKRGQRPVMDPRVAERRSAQAIPTEPGRRNRGDRARDWRVGVEAGGMNQNLYQQYVTSPNIVLQGGGTTPTYNDIARRLQEAGLTDQQVSEGLQSLAQGRPLSGPAAEHGATIGELGTLMYGIESARNPLNAAMAPMMTELIADDPNGQGVQSAFVDRDRPHAGGDYPASMDKSQAAGRHNLREENRPEGERPRGGAVAEAGRELAGREDALIGRWMAKHQGRIVATVMATHKDLAGLSAEAVRATVHEHTKTYIKTYLAQAYALDLSRVAGPSPNAQARRAARAAPD